MPFQLLLIITTRMYNVGEHRQATVLLQRSERGPVPGDSQSFPSTRTESRPLSLHSKLFTLSIYSRPLFPSVAGVFTVRRVEVLHSVLCQLEDNDLLHFLVTVNGVAVKASVQFCFVLFFKHVFNYSGYVLGIITGS